MKETITVSTNHCPLCRCCTPQCADDPVLPLNAYAVKCLECGEFCTCQGCEAEYEALSGSSGGLDGEPR